MRCPICDGLQRDQSHECQVEATAVLAQRRQMVHPAVPEPELGDTVLTSRKRQAHIVLKLEQHKAKAHCA